MNDGILTFDSASAADLAALIEFVDSQETLSDHVYNDLRSWIGIVPPQDRKRVVPPSPVSVDSFIRHLASYQPGRAT